MVQQGPWLLEAQLRQILVLSVTNAGHFFVRTNDPVASCAECVAMVKLMRDAPEILLDAPVVYKG